MGETPHIGGEFFLIGFIVTNKKKIVKRLTSDVAEDWVIVRSNRKEGFGILGEVEVVCSDRPNNKSDRFLRDLRNIKPPTIIVIL